MLVGGKKERADHGEALDAEKGRQLEKYSTLGKI